MSDRESTLRDVADRISELIGLGLGHVRVTCLIAPQEAVNEIQRVALPRKDQTDKRPSVMLYYGRLGEGGLKIIPTDALLELAMERISND